MKYFLFCLILLTTMTAHAACPIAEASARKNGMEFALSLYTQCALTQNDDETQLLLARYYNTQQKNMNQSLFYYHLAADNGNAVAQTELATLLLELDKNATTRQQILDYYKTIQNMITGKTLSGLKLTKITPYALLVLANEPIDKKWYYSSATKTDPTTAKHLQSYAKKLSGAKKAAGQQEVQAFKNRKLLEAAQTILSPAEYDTFQSTIFPQTGEPDAFTAKQQLDLLKEKIESLQNA